MVVFAKVYKVTVVRIEHIVLALARTTALTDIKSTVANSVEQGGADECSQYNGSSQPQGIH